MPSPSRSIGVLTFHRCINYGSYWQARCLVEGLRARGHDARLLDHRCRRVESAELRNAFQPTLPRRSPRDDLRHYGRKVRAFEAAFAGLPMTAPFALDRPQDAGCHDAVVVGSDEVWNLAHPWYGHQRIFYGDGLCTPKRVAYAASFGSYDAARGLDHDRAALLARFDAIAVRDRNSHALVADALGRDVDTVLDPVLQFPPSPVTTGSMTPRRYALVYGHSFPESFRARAVDWACARGLVLVSVGYRNAWADEQAIAAGPLDFARLMAGAEAVVTNFFHGAVFAIVNDKPFACASSPYRANKLADLTSRLGLGERLLGEDAASRAFAAALERPPSADMGDRLARLRASSTDFLDRALA